MFNKVFYLNVICFVLANSLS